MSISAVYGTGVYNQSRYGQVFISASGSISFQSSSYVEGQLHLTSNSSILFSSVSSIGSGSSSKVDLLFSTQSHALGGRVGSSSIQLSSYADLSAAASRIYGEAFISFSNPLSNLEGNGVLRGDENLFIKTDGYVIGLAEAVGKEEIIFSNPRALTNVFRIKSHTPFFFIIQKSEITYENKNPYYPTWNGNYIDLSSNNNQTPNYLNLLYTETSGPTDLPYKETVE